ncbi:MAG: aminoglycoside phosphotransferase family protein [Bacteroidetes bacterium]|nr:aminoglycoside phosphotransferase family protein [Bacteroidota bacterium]
MTDILKIVQEFRIKGKPNGFEKTGSGHINDSYRIRISPEGSQEYLLQRINHHIFTDVPLLTDNILKVTKHISQKIHSGVSGVPFVGLSLIPSGNNIFFHKDEDGNYWRMFNFIEGSRSFDLVPGPELAYEGGIAFGRFLSLTSDMDATGLTETIKDFHNIETRLEAFRKVCIDDPCNRVAEAVKEIKFIEARADEMHTILSLGRSGQIPLRVTHNDTKFNNILFDSNNKAICIVDLDTVMPGYVHYDFGDAIRTGANSGAEDEADLMKVNINLVLFKAYSKGFLEIAGEFLTEVEKAHLAFSARFMTFIIGLRFFTDYLGGDTYYKTHFPYHNLQRARAQLKLVQSMEENASAMETIISDLCKKSN